MSEEADINKKEDNENENKEEETKKKKKKKKKKAEIKEEKTEKNEKPEEDNEVGYNKDITRNDFNKDEKDDIKESSKDVRKKKKKKKKKETEEDNENKEQNNKEDIQEKENNENTYDDKDNNENKEMDINDILNNNNNNNGDLMITELLDVNGNKKKKKKKHKKENNENIENIDNENNDNETENDNIKEIVNEEEKPLDEKNKYLNDKLNSLDVSESLKTGINKGIIKSNEELHEDIKNNKLVINKKLINSSDLLSLNKSIESILSGGNKKVFLTDVNKFTLKENIKNYKFLKTEEQILRKNIEKLNQNQKLIENSIPLESSIIESNIRKSQLKDIYKAKDELMLRLEKITQKVDILLSEEKLRQKKIRQNLTDILEDDEDKSEKFNLHLAEIQKNEEKIRQKYNIDLQNAINKKNEELDKKEKNIKELKQKLINDAKEREKKIFLKRKNEIDEKMEKTKKFINEKFQKSEKDYLFYRYQENYDKKEKKLFDKINMNKKDPLVTQEELKQLSEKIEQQKQYLQDNAEEKRRQMQKLWNYRSQTLPTYRHPLVDKIEEEKMKRLNDEEDDKKKKECNQLEKINYKPPSVKINTKLKQIREKRFNTSNKDMVLETELNNKKRLDKLRFSPIITNKNPIIQDEKSLELNNNNYIDLNEVKKSLIKKAKKKLKPIQILHPKSEKPIDYLKEMKEKRNMSNDNEKKKPINFDDLFSGNLINGNIIETLEVAKIRTESLDRKVERKKEFMNSNGGYLKNPYLAGEIGDLLVESIQAKLKLMNKLGGGEES